MVDTWGGSWGTSWATSWTRTGAAATPEPVVRRGAPRRSWEPERYYLPPGTKKRKKLALKKLKELYEEAKREIPAELQRGLLPTEVIVGRRAVATLPSAPAIDFEALARSLETIRVLIAALEAAYEQKRQEEERIKKRRREEEALIAMLAEIL